MGYNIESKNTIYLENTNYFILNDGIMKLLAIDRWRNINFNKRLKLLFPNLTQQKITNYFFIGFNTINVYSMK